MMTIIIMMVVEAMAIASNAFVDAHNICQTSKSMHSCSLLLTRALVPRHSCCHCRRSWQKSLYVSQSVNYFDQCNRQLIVCLQPVLKPKKHISKFIRRPQNLQNFYCRFAEILQKFVAFSEYMNFKAKNCRFLTYMLINKVKNSNFVIVLSMKIRKKTPSKVGNFSEIAEGV